MRGSDGGGEEEGGAGCKAWPRPLVSGVSLKLVGVRVGGFVRCSGILGGLCVGRGLGEGWVGVGAGREGSRRCCSCGYKGATGHQPSFFRKRM